MYKNATLRECQVVVDEPSNLDDDLPFFQRLSLAAYENALPYINGTHLHLSKLDYKRAVIADGFSISIVIPSAHRHSQALDTMRRAVSESVGREVFINLYFTKGTAPTFRKHYDAHDLLARQFLGIKVWRLYGPCGALGPSGGIVDDQSSHVSEIVMRPGCLVYIPKGVIHHVFTVASPSAHLTFAFRQNAN